MRAGKPAKKELVPFQKESVATHQQGIPLTYFAGTRLMAVRWISPATNRLEIQVPSGGKKG